MILDYFEAKRWLQLIPLCTAVRFAVFEVVKDTEDALKHVEALTWKDEYRQSEFKVQTSRFFLDVGLES